MAAHRAQSEAFKDGTWVLRGRQKAKSPISSMDLVANMYTEKTWTWNEKKKTVL